MNEKYIKLFEDFNNKSFPNILKKICLIIRKDIINNGNNIFEKEYNIDNFNIIIKVNYKKAEKQPYYSNINIYDVTSNINNDNPVLILINVSDLEIDINYLMSIISHEIRHIYDIYTTEEDDDVSDFLKSISVTKFKGRNEFINLVYLSLEHELIARHNMLYELYRWINIIDKQKLLEIFKESYVYTALQNLKMFDHDKFTQNNKDIQNFTIEFSKSINDDFDGNIEKYYDKWETFFHKKSDEFLNYVDKMLDDIIDDIKNDRIYERLCGYISYNEDINSNVSKNTFNNILMEKNNMEK